jgi:hypothetical protein
MKEGRKERAQRRGGSRAAGGRSGLGRFRRIGASRDAGTMLAAFALLIQVWLPWAHQPAMAMPGVPPQYARLLALFGDEPALCLAGVTKRAGYPAKAPSHQLSDCPFCPALHQLGLVPSASTVVVAGVSPPSDHAGIAQAPIVARAFNPSPQPRAPPTIA